MPRKPPVRTQTEQINVRLTTEEKDRLQAALERLVAGRPGLRGALGPYLLDLGLADAERILAGKK